MSTLPKKYFWVHEIAGMLNSWKSTLIARVRELIPQNFKVRIIREAARRCPFPKLDNQGSQFSYNLWCIADTTKALLEITQKGSPQTVVLIDRGPYDRLCFLSALEKHQYLTKKELKLLESLSEKLTELVHSVSLHLCTPKISLERDEKHNEDKTGIVMNPSFLETLYREYLSFNCNKPLLTVDSEKKSIEESSRLLADFLRQNFIQKQKK